MKALLDACVIYPTIMRELLLGAAKAGFYEALWSPRILREWELAAARSGADVAAAARVDMALMGDGFREALVDPEDLILDLALPDPDDDHVLAAAVTGGAAAIVTKNHKDFPLRILGHYGIARSDPDEMLLRFWDEDAARMKAVVAEVVARTETISGKDQDTRRLLKRTGLPRLGKRAAA